MTEHSEHPTDQPTEASASPSPAPDEPAAVEPEPAVWAPPTPTLEAGEPSPDAAAATGAHERPELAVGGAFAGGFVLAMILRRLAR